jgi:hypothetical protein
MSAKICFSCKNLDTCETEYGPKRPPCASENLLTQNDTAFILWCFGYLLGQSDKMDQGHKEFIQKNHDRILSKIAKLHEDL